ncbi:hypothetical protein SAMN03159453_00189 [Pseudomonas sp. NFIX28]|nr:hypothetical protein SAMN03159453_00189 [Pseudomonas sp. NFIX28]
MIDRCCLVTEGGELVVQFLPEGLKGLGSMSIDRIYIEGKTLFIHKADPAIEKSSRTGASNNHSEVRDSNSFTRIPGSCPIGIM